MRLRTESYTLLMLYVGQWKALRGDDWRFPQLNSA